MVASAICASGDRETRSPRRAAAMFVSAIFYVDSWRGADQVDIVGAEDL